MYTYLMKVVSLGKQVFNHQLRMFTLKTFVSASCVDKCLQLSLPFQNVLEILSKGSGQSDRILKRRSTTITCQHRSKGEQLWNAIGFHLRKPIEMLQN